MFDAVYVPGGDSVKVLSNEPDALHFIAEAFKHCKPIGSDKDAVDLLKKAIPEIKLPAKGVCTNEKLQDFVKDIELHRFWDRQVNPVVPA